MSAVHLPSDTAPVMTSILRRIAIEDRGHSTPCWIWQGSLNGKGYAYDSIRTGANVRVHRATYMLFVGPIGDGLHLDHLCNVRPCVNPAHLEPVTLAENNQRMFRRLGFVSPKPVKTPGIPRKLRTHCVHGHEYTPENIYLRRDGRSCRLCQQRDAKKSGEKRKRKAAIEV